MAVKCPNSALSGSKHISSKLTVWKKTWAHITDMISTSGFGWNDATNMVTVDSTDVWDNYVKVITLFDLPFCL
ncbi:hypothetical protein, partial [Aeromonas veronii]|uniref:hypothetical protein n=1 Tax=Aeromonas veronii TaxID=654 RepID=UPI00406C3DAD